MSSHMPSQSVQRWCRVGLSKERLPEVSELNLEPSSAYKTEVQPLGCGYITKCRRWPTHLQAARCNWHTIFTSDLTPWKQSHRGLSQNPPAEISRNWICQDIAPLHLRNLAQRSPQYGTKKSKSAHISGLIWIHNQCINIHRLPTIARLLSTVANNPKGETGEDSCLLDQKCVCVSEKDGERPWQKQHIADRIPSQLSVGTEEGVDNTIIMLI